MKKYTLRLTPEECKILDARARSLGFAHRAEYVRFMMLMELTVTEKIDALYRKMIKNE